MGQIRKWKNIPNTDFNISRSSFFRTEIEEERTQEAQRRPDKFLREGVLPSHIFGRNAVDSLHGIPKIAVPFIFYSVKILMQETSQKKLYRKTS